MSPSPARWPVQDAKARFSEMLDVALQHGPQVVTRHGKDTAVVMSVRDWQRLAPMARPSLKALLLSDIARGEIPIPSRKKTKLRPPPDLS